MTHDIWVDPSLLPVSFGDTFVIGPPPLRVSRIIWMATNALNTRDRNTNVPLPAVTWHFDFPKKQPLFLQKSKPKYKNKKVTNLEKMSRDTFANPLPLVAFVDTVTVTTRSSPPRVLLIIIRTSP